jgi:hypothetical protein
MIHCCNQRWWYVNDYLLPSLLNQGINADDITIYRDMYNEGNLTSCINSFLMLPEDGGTWHLQDDVIVASNFKKRTEELDAGLVCGFCCEYDVNRKNNGVVSVVDMWYSFPCIRIPNNIALEFVEWFNKGKEFNFELKHMANRNKNDDLLFKYFLERYHMSANVILVNPNLVDHVDYLIGGSTVNQQRDKIVRSLYFEDLDLVDCLKESLIKEED